MRVWDWLGKNAVACGLAAGCLLIISQAGASTPAAPRPKVEGPVAVLPLVSWEHPYRVAGLPEERRTWQDDVDAIAQLMTYHTILWEKGRRPEPGPISAVWKEVAQIPAALISAQGVELVAPEKVEAAISQSMPEFWDVDSRTPEKVAAFAESTGAQHVMVLELLPSRFSIRLTFGDWITFQAAAPQLVHVVARVEIYDRAGRSEFASAAVGQAKSETEVEAWRSAIWQALAPWLGRPANSSPPAGAMASGTVSETIVYGPEKLSRPEPVEVGRGAKVGIAVFSVNPDQRSWNAKKLTGRLPGRLADYWRSRGLSVVELPSPAAGSREAGSTSGQLRTTAALADLGRSRGVSTVVCAEVLGAYSFTPKTGTASGPYYVVLATVVEVASGRSAKRVAGTEERGASIEEQIYGLLKAQ